MEVRPELRNRAQFIQQLERRYPPMLRDAGIGGTVVLWVFINERASGAEHPRDRRARGTPARSRSPRPLMQEVAQFSPALNRDQRVPVWISIPVTFQTRNS
jgi:hypothetical protein